MKSLSKFLLCPLFCAAVAATATAAETNAYPSDKITVVIPYSPGNGLDLLGRQFAEALRQQMNVPFIVENRDGAAGAIGTLHAARAKADGYTLLFTANPPFLTAPLAVGKPPYDPLKSFIPVARVATAPLVLVVSSKQPIHDVAQLKEFAVKNPQQANYASAGIGSPGQIYGELLNQAMGIKMQEIRYKATGQALLDVMAGNVLTSLISMSAAASHIENGELRALAVGSTQRIAGFQNVPTLAEALGRKDFEASVWYGFLAPAGTPGDRIAMLNRQVAHAAESAKIQDFLHRQFMVRDVQDSAHFSSSMQHELQISKKLVQQANLRAK
ncbi:Bug family tripartite tricarboxylate transporter substrate binding protein [Candidimonas nitroreducens]|uniref:ABC transporter substrate-binding protein n=1 Tax=Candidimonas nitroreducens TaxID=683354 RepID=A0A225MYQ7_9BURK|nr:tripartite tricarboxylate transporter substrate binding protein [Candidimonas nitroreducens]OWT66355.1 hypothetical protein CEY11_01060 [Candidimonas nitroreducens]